jgi:hypothetical protein
LNLAKLPACLVLFSGIACAAPALAADQALAAAPSTTDWRFSFQEDARQIFSTRTLAILGVGGLLTAGAHAIEDPDQQARTFDQFGDIPDFGNTYGSSTVVVGGSAALALWGWTTERPTFAAAGVDMMRSYAYSTALVGALKIAFDRTRPMATGTRSRPVTLRRPFRSRP